MRVNENITIMGMFFAMVVLVVAMLVGYNLYTNEKSREMYVACLAKSGSPSLTRHGAMCSTF